jgi:hypothetical protein
MRPQPRDAEHARRWRHGIPVGLCDLHAIRRCGTRPGGVDGTPHAASRASAHAPSWPPPRQAGSCSARRNAQLHPPHLIDGHRWLYSVVGPDGRGAPVVGRPHASWDPCCEREPRFPGQQCFRLGSAMPPEHVPARRLLYDGIDASPYGRIVFVDVPERRVELIGGRSECIAAVKQRQSLLRRYRVGT